LIESQAIRRVIPDLVEVCLGARGEDKVTGYRSFDVCFRLRAMNASKSNGVEGPLSSPSIRTARMTSLATDLWPMIVPPFD